MVELYPGFFSMLRLAKSLYDSSLMDKMPDYVQSLALDEDCYYEMAYEAIDIVFEDTFHDCNDDSGIETYVFCDPVIEQFCKLCWQYEQRRHLTEAENPYRKDIERIIRSGFYLNGYDYDFDWKLSVKDRGRRRLLFFNGEEFCGLDELPEGLLEIRAGFQELNFKLEKALSSLARKEPTEKEAA